jgi:NADH:ubiquinone oxidoreductase subunit 3 (subunit A)
VPQDDLEKPMAEFALTLLSFLVFGVAVLLLLGWTLQ